MAGILVTLTRAAALVLTLALVPPVLGAEDAPLEAPDSGEGNGDYLAPLLREAVEDLKAELATPTSRGNAQARARTAWDWINAYALDGRYVPVNATLSVARALSTQANIAAYRALDATLTELAFLDDRPDALGTLRATEGPFEAGSDGTITQTYTVGAAPVQTGGGFMLARHFMANFGAWQTTAPTDPNYVTIESNNPKVSFVATTAPMTGMHGGFRSQRETLVFRIASGTLEPGDVVTITYGDTRQGSIGMRMPTMSSDRMPLPVYLALNATTRFLSLPIQPVRIRGSQLAGVTGFAPSVVKPGERFELAVRGRDAFYNRARDVDTRWLLTLNDEPWRTIDAKDAVTVVALALDEPGVYRIGIRSGDGRIEGEVNPMLVTGEARPRIFWGDTHGHSGFAEGIGTPERFMRWARDDARLDFVTHSEHDIWLDDAEWEVLRANVQRYTEPGRFIAYLGYEWSVANTSGGHHNVLFRTPEGRQRVPAQFFPTLSRLYQGLRSSAETRDVVVIPHAHQAGDYRLNDPELEPLIEIMSQHGNFEWFGRMYLQHGHQVGFTAASDNHLSQPGYSAPQGGSLSQRGGLGAILAEERTTDGIFDGMKALRAYATTGDRIILDFTVNGATMGERTAFNEERTISGRVIGTAPIDRVDIIKNGRALYSEDYLTVAEDRYNRTDRVLLSFRSDAEPVHPGDNPRGWRTWEGTLRVVNAELEAITANDASFPQELSLNEAEANSARFSTKTRGDTSSFVLKLTDIQRTARVELDLVESRESGGAPAIYRRHQRVPAVSLSLGLKDIAAGQVTATQPVDAYIDQVTLRRIITDSPRDVTFSIRDKGQTQGDYYFVRVVQANDAIAWSSPIWVGGYGKR